MIGAQLNVTDARHRLARKIFFGQRGELRQHYFDTSTLPRDDGRGRP
jgi:TnpA family transposase